MQLGPHEEYHVKESGVPVGIDRVLRRVRVLVVLALLISLGCTAGPSERPPVAVRDADLAAQPPPDGLTTAVPTLPPPGKYHADLLLWEDCTDLVTEQLGADTGATMTTPPIRVDCAEIQVGADQSAPLLRDFLTLDLTRIGDGPAVLVVLTEVTGEPGTVRAARLASELPPAMLESYTLVGLARRGTGPTDPLDCTPPATRERIVGLDPEPRLPGQLELVLGLAASTVQACTQLVGERLSAISSANTADDLETLRIRLGSPVLNVLAHGEASRAVTEFIRRYPSSVGRIVLDGAHDPTLDAVTAAEAAMLAADQGFTAFAADCVASSVRPCPLGADPRAALASLAEQLRRAPLSVGSQQITAGTAYQAVLETLGSPARWPELSQALAAARDGDGTRIAALVEPVLTPTRGLPARFDPALATHCNDTRMRVPPERAAQLVEQWRQRSALFGPLFAQRLLLCSSWPVPTAAPTGPGTWGVPSVLVVATVNDPVMPADGARRTAESLPSAVLVSWQGEAHGALPHSRCMADLVTRFLVDGHIPLSGTLCPP